MKTYIVYLTIALLPLLTTLHADDWALYHGPNHNCVSEEHGLKLSDWTKEGPRLLWKQSLHEGFGGAAIKDNEAYIIDRETGTADKLICFNLKTGEEKWSFTHEYEGKLPHHGSRGVPLIEEDAIYFNGGFGQIYRVNRHTHKLDWIIEIQEQYDAEAPKWGWSQSPLIVGNTLIIAPMSEAVGLAGVDKHTGKEIWRTHGIGNSHSSPKLLTLQGVPQVLFLAVKKGKDKGEEKTGITISVDPTTGKVLWETNSYMNSIPITQPTKIDEERIFLTGGYDCGSAMIRVKHHPEGWKVSKLWDIKQGAQLQSPIIHDGHIYMLANENSNHKAEEREKGGLMCLDFDGKIMWNTGSKPFMGRGNIIFAQNKLLIQDGELGYLRVVDPNPSSYKELSFADPFNKKREVEERIAAQEGRKNVKLPSFKFWSPMALSNGHLIMRAQTELACIDLR